jgi:hypothetical protein
MACLSCMMLLHYFCKRPCFFWRLYCAGAPVFIPAGACCRRHCCCLRDCCCLRPCCCSHSWYCWRPFGCWGGGVLLIPYVLTVAGLHAFAGVPAVLRIRDILVWIRIWIRGSMTLTNGSGCGSGSCYFRH